MAILTGTGLGAFPAGVGPFGHDPEAEVVGQAVQAPLEANYFDPYDRVYVQRSDQTMVGTTVAIQRAALLMLPKGALPASASSGIDVDRIRRASEDARERVIDDEVRRSWKVLLDAKLIELRGIQLDTTTDPWNGRFYVDVIDLTTQAGAKLGFQP